MRLWLYARTAVCTTSRQHVTVTGPKWSTCIMNKTDRCIINPTVGFSIKAADLWWSTGVLWTRISLGGVILQRWPDWWRQRIYLIVRTGARRRRRGWLTINVWWAATTINRHHLQWRLSSPHSEPLISLVITPTHAHTPTNQSHHYAATLISHLAYLQREHMRGRSWES